MSAYQKLQEAVIELGDFDQMEKDARQYTYNRTNLIRLLSDMGVDNILTGWSMDDTKLDKAPMSSLVTEYINQEVKRQTESFKSNIIGAYLGTITLTTQPNRL